MLSRIPYNMHFMHHLHLKNKKTNKNMHFMHLLHSGLGDLKSSEGAIPSVFVVPERLFGGLVKPSVCACDEFLEDQRGRWKLEFERLMPRTQRFGSSETKVWFKYPEVYPRLEICMEAP